MWCCWLLDRRCWPSLYHHDSWTAAFAGQVHLKVATVPRSSVRPSWQISSGGIAQESVIGEVQKFRDSPVTREAMLRSMCERSNEMSSSSFSSCACPTCWPRIMISFSNATMQCNGAGHPVFRPSKTFFDWRQTLKLKVQPHVLIYIFLLL